IDLLERRERDVRSRLHRRQLGLGRWRLRETGHAQPRSGGSHGRRAEEPAALTVDRVRAFDLAHPTAPAIPPSVSSEREDIGAHAGIEKLDLESAVFDRPRLPDQQTRPVEDRTFEIEFLDPGVRAYVFTFG